MADQFPYKSGAPSPTNPLEWGKNLPGVQGLIKPKLPTSRWEQQFSDKGVTAFDPGGIGKNTGVGIDPRLDTTPDVAGTWLDKGKLGLGIAEVGLGVYNALETSKMNKFMRGYYGDTMERDTADFENNAKSYNEQLSSRQARVLSAQGVAQGSDESKAGVASYMDQWGAKETF